MSAPSPPTAAGAGTGRGKRTRRAAPAATLAALAALLAGCGAGVASPDLFLVERSGAPPARPLTLLVSEEGLARCDDGASHRLSDPRILEARTIAEDLEKPSARHLALPAAPGSVFHYDVRDAAGALSFADNSTGQSKAMRELQLFVVRVATQVCHLPQ